MPRFAGNHPMALVRQKAQGLAKTKSAIFHRLLPIKTNREFEQKPGTKGAAPQIPAEKSKK